MNIDISSRDHKHPLPDALKEHVVEKMSKLDRYAVKAESAHVIFEPEKINHTCEIVILARQKRFTASETTNAIQASFDAALSNIQNQLRRHHDKMKRHKGAHKRENIRTHQAMEDISVGDEIES